MKDPTRLLDAVIREAALRLLRAGASEEPPPDALASLSLVLGLPAPATQPAAPGGMAAGAGAKLANGWLVLAACGLAAVGGASWLAMRDRPEPPPPPAASAPLAPLAQPEAAPSPAPLPQPEAAPAPQPEAARAPALAEEIARLDAVRRLLASGQGRAALGALQRYTREHPRGELRQEAELLRIEASRRAGQPDKARALARRFLADNPDSPHAARVRELSQRHAR
jgi:hypothetical protein